jgi:hypothetical protein
MRRRPSGGSAGIDPSATTVQVAQRRNRLAVEGGRVVLRQTGAEAIPGPDDAFDGVVAVNSIQFWPPLELWRLAKSPASFGLPGCSWW